MLFGNLKPAKPVPLPPRCDKLVMDILIQQAKEAEATMNCTNSCDLGENITLPNQRMKPGWPRIDLNRKEEEVLNGMELFRRAILKLSELVSNDTLTTGAVKKIKKNIYSILNVLESINVKVKEKIKKKEEFTDLDSLQTTQTVWTLNEFFFVYTKFVSGKTTIYVSDSCKQMKT